MICLVSDFALDGSEEKKSFAVNFEMFASDGRNLLHVPSEPLQECFFLKTKLI